MPNYTNSPKLRKFVDTLPGLTEAAKNNLGQYIPVAAADQKTYPGSDYYEIGVVDHREKMHSDLPAAGTRIRGYYQINDGTLRLGTAERADVVVDFSQYAGQTLILYNDAPAAWPAGDARYDYYTGNGDTTFNGGAPSTQAGYGPNTRTIMQIQVAAVDPVNGSPVSSITLLNGGARYSDPTVTLTDGVNTDTATATVEWGHITGITYTGTVKFVSAPRVRIEDTDTGIGSGASAIATLSPGTLYDSASLIAAVPGVFTATQDPPLVPEGKFARIFDTSMTINGKTIPFQSKAISEEFDFIYGRMNAMLGTEWWIINNQGQQTNGFAYIDPATETVPEGETQIWKIVHNGVDTHTLHFHLVNVQVINRTDWAGVIKPPDENEKGWKETVRVDPLEDIFVAVRPARPTLPANWPDLLDSVRPLDPSSPLGSTAGFTQPFPDPNNPAGSTTRNRMVNFGHEYVWHCHILGHEEMDMMRPLVLQVPRDRPEAPVLLSADVAGTPVAPPNPWQGPPLRIDLRFRDKSINEAGFRLKRTDVTGTTIIVATLDPSPGIDGVISYSDTAVVANTKYDFRVFAFVNNPKTVPDSLSSNVLQVTTPVIPNAPVALTAKASTLSANPPTVALTWNDKSNNETGFRIQRATNNAFTIGLTAQYVGPGIVVFTDTTVGLNTTYFYRVSAFNQGGFSANSNTRSVKTAGQLPGVPTGLAITTPAAPAGQTSLVATWAAPTTGAPVLDYLLQRAATETGTYATVTGGSAITTTSFTNTGLLANRTYWYRVRARNAYGSGGWSVPASGTTLP